MLNIFAGFRMWTLAVVVLVVIGIGYITIQRLQDSGRLDLLNEQLQEQLELRERIDEADRTSPRNVDDADRLLRDFLNSNR